MTNVSFCKGLSKTLAAKLMSLWLADAIEDETTGSAERLKL